MFRIIKLFSGFLALVAAIGLVAFLFARQSIPDIGAAQRVASVEDDVLASAISKSRLAVARTRDGDHYPSLSVSVNTDGATVWTEAVGLKDLRDRKSATPATVYAIGSISKSLTAAAAIKLVEAGALDLDSYIRVYAPGLPRHYESVTMRQLLSHQAGVRHYRFAFTPPVFSENGLNREFASVEDSLSLFIDDPLLFEPDAGFSYSTFGYTLASYVMEQAGGESFLTLMEQTLFSPLGMRATSADRMEAADSDRAADYLSPLRRLGVFEAPETNSSYKWAGGGFKSTPDDLARFGAAMMRGEYVSPASFAMMTTPRRIEGGDVNPQSYGLGWRTGTMPYPRGSKELTPIIHHGGTASGSECALLLAPELSISVAVCGNAFTGGSGGLIRLAADIARNFADERASDRSVDP